jgi:ribonuclease-3
MYGALADSLGIHVEDSLLSLAFTHRSFAYESGGLPTNERLEFLGDSVLGLVITQELYLRFPEMDESKLSPIRSGVVNTRALAQIARALDIAQYIRIGKGEESSGGRDKNSILADALEALVGAIYLQYGFVATSEIVISWFRDAIEQAHIAGATLDAKTALQEIASIKNLTTPEYEIEESGPDHNKSFTARAILSGEKFPQGEGKSKREAEQVAAKLAYDLINSRP